MKALLFRASDEPLYLSEILMVFLRFCGGEYSAKFNQGNADCEQPEMFIIKTEKYRCRIQADMTFRKDLNIFWGEGVEIPGVFFPENSKTPSSIGLID